MLEFLFWLVVVGVALAILNFLKNLIIMPLVLGIFWYFVFEYFMHLGPLGAIIGVIAGLYLAKDQLMFDLGKRPESKLDKRIAEEINVIKADDMALELVNNHKSQNIAHELERLLELKNKGVLSSEEFEQAKAKIIN